LVTLFWTTTLNAGYGSKYYCDELGFMLNNEMDDFSSKPGVPNMFGLVGNEGTVLLPVRMLSSMTLQLLKKWSIVYGGSPGIYNYNLGTSNHLKRV
jgi:gamma-glutamyltranspeptidase/glutathione hydrolase